jgi:hypothetical protein
MDYFIIIEISHFELSYFLPLARTKIPETISAIPKNIAPTPVVPVARPLRIFSGLLEEGGKALQIFFFPEL